MRLDDIVLDELSTGTLNLFTPRMSLKVGIGCFYLKLPDELGIRMDLKLSSFYKNEAVLHWPS